MEKRNDIISGLQFGIIAFFLSGSIFVGLGITSMFSLISRDAWISTLIAVIICIIPLFLLIYIIDYEPEKNIFEKNNILFGKWIGFFINIFLFFYVFFMVILVLWSTTSLAITMYLIKTPESFIATIFVLTAVYAVTKGIETIGRTSEILFFLTVTIMLITTFSLIPQVNLDYFKPILVKGITPAIQYAFNFSSYFFTPLIILSVVPKNNITNNNNYKRYLIGGIILGFLLMFTVFTLTPGVITPELASIYRFPAYYVHRKISIGGAINNLENFLSLHWYFNVFLLFMAGLYFLKKYIEQLFKIKRDKTINIIIVIIGVIIIISNKYLFSDTVNADDFMKYAFPQYVSLSLLVLTIIICLTISINKHKKKA